MSGARLRERADGGPNWVRLDGPVNARDLGGMPVAGGMRVRAGRLFRSDHLDLCTPGDVALLRDRIGVGLIVDLRNLTRERGGAGPVAINDAIETVNIALMADLDEVAEVLRDPALDGMGGFYLQMAERDRARIVEVFRTIAGRCREPIWFHCTSGKDRTGTIAALLLDLLGADSESIVADYACSILEPKVLADHVRRIGWRTDGIPSAHLRADAESMRSFLAKFHATHGSARGWLVAGGLEPEHVVRLRTELLETSVA